MTTSRYAVSLKKHAALVLALLFLLVCTCGIVGTVVYGETDELTQEEQIQKMARKGQGWLNAELVIQNRDPRSKEIVETYPGLVSMKQSQTKFRLQIETLEGWQMMETRIYVGLDQAPTAADKKPVTALFPYKEIFSTPADSYQLLLDPAADLGIESFKGYRGEPLYIVVYTKLRGTGDRGQTIIADAWARADTEGIKDDNGNYVKKPNSYPFIEGTTDVCFILYEITDDEIEDIRKNVSKNPECETTKVKIEIMHYYVQARRANGDPVTLEYETIVSMDVDGNITATETEERKVVKPLVSVYAEEVPGPDTNYPDIYTGEMTNVASDIYASVSLDEGETWKITNLSRAADRSSFNLVGDESLPYTGFAFPGQVKKPNVKQQGNNIMVAWTSKYARSGNPTYSLDEYLPVLDEDGNPELNEDGNIVFSDVKNPYYEDDIWGVGGAQRSKDYTNVEAGFPGIEIPYSVVWTCRGFVKDDGTIVWMKPERLTSGRRDAEQVAVASSPAGFTIVWQEDPDGLRPGDGAGPGHGWSGATTNHKTDIWYSYIEMKDFQRIDNTFVSGGESGYDPDDPDKGKGRPKAKVPMKLPVRLTDNDTLNTENMKIPEELIKDCPPTLNPFPDTVGDDELQVLYKSDWLDWLASENSDTVETSQTSVTADEIGLASCDDGGCGDGGGGEDGKGQGDGSHRYGLEHPTLLWRPSSVDSDQYILFYKTTNNQNVEKKVAITADNRLLDGDTGSSRATIMMQNYTNTAGVTSAWAVLAYEESKGTGSGPPIDADEDSDGGSGCGCGDDDGDGGCGSDGEPGSGEGSSRYFPDRGKLIIYHTFDFQKPDMVSGGNILNPQEIEASRDADGRLIRDADGNLQDLTLSYLRDAEGNYINDWKGDLIPNYENARRPRFIIQSKALATASNTKTGTVLVSIFKMGTDGKGAPADIITMRWETSPADSGNPYKWTNLVTRSETYLDVDTDGNLAAKTIKIADWQNVSAVTPREGYWTEEETTKGELYNRIYSWDQTEDNLYNYTWEQPGISARAHRGFIRGDFLAIAYTFTPNWRQARNNHDVWDVYIRRSFDGGKTWTTDPLSEQTYPMEQLNIMKEPDGIRYIDKHTIENPGDFQPARNISMFKNNREIAIEPRLVGQPGNTSTLITEKIAELVEGVTVGQSVVLFPQDYQNQNSFWMTYGTEANVEDGAAVDLYYSVTADKGETFRTEADPKFLNTDTNEENPYYTWNWLAKNRQGIEMEQAESQIRYLPDGSVFYAVWNESSEAGSDGIFRRIFRASETGDIIAITTSVNLE